ncbi:TPA: LOW QUALITY PROTEIN: hypothetical protein N0F65_005278 [Lagenidium giganteum]|uniref:Ion transport domain-containing protein n=1 Tax=Lagenidium giganteum TaxID=4803 RepID=A0AAV2YYB2_9STRA|nr:TPA: LOW QUALITY PROTEIN: hypothetical protein N0F65_005278 [Lagenidium giganteum]
MSKRICCGPIAPPGCEHLLTKQEWREYWTWLQWYAAWQMWYLGNDGENIKPSREVKKLGTRQGDRRKPSSKAWWRGSITGSVADAVVANGATAADSRASTDSGARGSTEGKRRSITGHRLSVDLAQVIGYSTSDVFARIGPRKPTIAPEVLNALTRRQRINFYLMHPAETKQGWIILHTIFLVLALNIGVMAAQTADGAQFRGSSPAYKWLPSKTTFDFAEAFFTLIYVIEFCLRCGTSKTQKAFWLTKRTILELLALAPFPLVIAWRGMHGDHPYQDPGSMESNINWLRFFRIIRLIMMSQVYDGSKVMFKAVGEAIPPLKITLFFLITVVMVFATGIYYAEPCYDLSKCTFTDIFNAGYFVMVTVATVGYGSQVPSLYNPGSLILTCVVMIFGTLYLSMPLAIIGIKYDSAWTEYEIRARQNSRANLNGSSPAIVAQAVKDDDGVDHTLEPLESRKVYTLSYHICDKFYEISQKMVEVNGTIEKLFREPESTNPEAAFQRAKARNDSTVKILESIMGVLKTHKKVCTEIRTLLPNGDKKISTSKESRGNSFQTREGSAKTSSMASTVFSRAKRALHSVGSRSNMKTKLQHADANSRQSWLWNLLEHNDNSRRGIIVNKVRLYLVVLSILLFYSQTMPELQRTGLDSLLCRRSIADFCKSNDQPGCYVYDGSGNVTSVKINFHCDDGSTDSTCFGVGLNYGSGNNASISCAEGFGKKGIVQVCSNRLCKTSNVFFYDMEPKWIYIEFFFGIIFTSEMFLRIYAHPVRKLLWKDFTLLIDFTSLFPFYVEFVEICTGVIPIYSIVPTAPSFFSIIRILKTFRILKLGTHISGSVVLARTGLLIYQRLMIPLFFLFIGCVISAAVFYELERGTECFIGKKCLWWGKNVLTPTFSHGPDGKRVLIQNTAPTIIVDMLRSTWFSLVTFTTTGYGDMKPRTSLGKLFDIFAMVFSACYTAMPLTLVGGQFYVCYEMYAIELKKKKGLGKHVEPKQQDPKKAIATGNVETRAPTPVSIAGLARNNDGSSSPTNESSTPATMIGAVNAVMLTSRRDMAENAESRRPSITTVEMQILNQFIMIHKVFTEVIEDLSKLNRLGSRRVSIRKGTGSDSEGESMKNNELQIERKIAENMTFCITVFLNFSPVIEKILGTNESHLRSSTATSTHPMQPPESP